MALSRLATTALAGHRNPRLIALPALRHLTSTHPRWTWLLVGVVMAGEIHAILDSLLLSFRGVLVADFTLSPERGELARLNAEHGYRRSRPLWRPVECVADAP